MFVGGLIEASNVGELWYAFSHYRKVIDVHLRKREGKARCFAFVRFMHIEELQRVLR